MYWFAFIAFGSSALVFSIIATNPNIPAYLRKIQFHLVTTLLVLFGLLASLGLLLQVLLRLKTPAYYPAFLSLLVLATSSLALWNLDIYRPTLRLLGLLVILLLPTLAIVHLNDSTHLHSIYREAHCLPTVGATDPNPPLGALLDFYYLKRQAPTCQLTGANNESLQAQLRWRDSAMLFSTRTVFYFFFVFALLRYYALAYQRYMKNKKESGERWELEGDVLAQSAGFLSVGTAALIALLAAGADFKQLGLFGGLVAAGVTVGLRDALANLAAGLMLLTDRTLRRNDVVTIESTANPEVGGTYGIVENVHLRYTVIKDRDEIRRLIPNSILINSVIENWTHSEKADRTLVRLKVKVGAPYYTATLKEIQAVLESVCYEVVRIVRSPAPKALLAGLGDSALVFSLRFWIRDPEKGIRSVISEVYAHAYERLEDIGVRIPFPQLDVHFDTKPPPAARREADADVASSTHTPAM